MYMTKNMDIYGYELRNYGAHKKACKNVNNKNYELHPLNGGNA